MSTKPHDQNYTTWPDGNMGRRPDHGEIYQDLRTNQFYYWHDYAGIWILDEDGINNKNLNKPKCECGTDTYGEGEHSDYCPKYVKI